jgi:hypothetical protein
VAGGEHRAGDVERPGGEVEQVGGAEPGVDDVDALAWSRPREGRRELDPEVRMSRAVHDLRRVDEAGESAAQGPGGVRVELLRDQTPRRRRP